MTVHAYLFELRGIQSGLFATGKLRDMVAGSELIDYLCQEPLDEALDACGLRGLGDAEYSPRRAGAAFYLVIDDVDKAQHFRQLWSICVAQLLPGLEAVDALATGNTAREAVERGLRALRSARNRPHAQLPGASPLARRNQRSGVVAVAEETGELVDAGTAIARRFNRPKGSRLVDRFYGEPNNVHWPDNFEASAASHRRFPLARNRLVGLVHADGNGVGQILRGLSAATNNTDHADYIRLYRSFSDGLERATVLAASDACSETLAPGINEEGVMPARPLVLGGDDLTVLVRADHALPFTRSYLLHFESRTRDFLTQLRHDMKAMKLPEAAIAELPSQLTACAGIIFMKDSQPFAQCYALAEDLCSRAKQQSREQGEPGKPIPSSLAFHRLQGTMFSSAEQLFQRELCVHDLTDKSNSLSLGLPAYGLKDNTSMPALAALHALAECFGPNQLNASRLRNLATLLHSDNNLARQDYARWRDLAGTNDVTANALGEFDRALERLLGPTSDSLPMDIAGRHSPLADLLSYLSIHRSVTEDSARA